MATSENELFENALSKRAASRDNVDFLYERLANEIACLIESGTLQPGDRLPSVRAYSQTQGVSLSTVLQAYRSLEDRQLVEARPQSGYYVRPQVRHRPDEPGISSPPLQAQQVSVSTLILEVAASALDPQVTPLSAAIPSPDLLPTEALMRTLACVARGGGRHRSSYLIPLGDQELRQEISRRNLTRGCVIPADALMITNGCMEALTISLRCVAREGSTIAVESPTYFGILQLIESLHMKALEIPTHPRHGISLEALEQAMRRHEIAACIVMPNFHNPLGCSMTDEHKQQLVDLARSYRVPLIGDDLYGDLYFMPPQPTSLLTFDRDDERRVVMHCGSFSKTLAPGFRIGWLAPGRHMETAVRIKLASTISSAAPLQLATAAFLKRGGYDRHLRRLRQAFAHNIDRMLDAVGAHFPPGTRATRPRGGFVLWIALPEAVDAVSLYQQALQKKISIAPGPIFSATDGYRNHIRLNGGYPWSGDIEQALKTLGRLVSTMNRAA
jgi:DNA-binding transcriptional MocR family regulator